MDKKRNPVWNRFFIQLIVIELCFQFGTYATTPIISNYAVALGATASIAGLLAGLNSTTAMFMRFVTGWISDRYSKKSLLVIAAVIFTISSFACSIANTPFTIGVCRVGMGIGFSLKSIIVVSFVRLVTDKEHVGSAVGWMGIASLTANVCGPYLGSVIGDTWGYSAAFSFASVSFLVAFALVALFNAPAVEEDAQTAASNKNKPFKLNLSEFFCKSVLHHTVMQVLISSTYSIALSFIILTSNERGIEGGAIYFTMYALMGFFSKPFSGKLLDKYGFVVIVPCLLINALGVFCFAFGDNTLWIAVGGALMGLGHASAHSCNQAESVRGVPKEMLGRAVNTFYIGADLGMGLSPVVAGAVLGFAGITGMYVFAACLPLFCIVLYFVFKPRFAKRES